MSAWINTAIQEWGSSNLRMYVRVSYDDPLPGSVNYRRQYDYVYVWGGGGGGREERERERELT